jgi:hypothetical protein
VPTPTRFEATALRYRFLAFDPADLTRVSAVKDWAAKLRLKGQCRDRGDHYEIELLALPKAKGIAIRYTTDGTSPTTGGSAAYDGPFRVPDNCRVVCAMAVCSEYNLNSEQISISIPQRGQQTGSVVDPQRPARWTQQKKLDDPGAVWDLIQRLEKTAEVRVYDISLTADSSDGHQNVEYSGAVDGGYDAAAVKGIAERLQDIVGGGSLRMTIGSLGFSTGQALLDWLKATNQPFNAANVTQ